MLRYRYVHFHSCFSPSRKAKKPGFTKTFVGVLLNKLLCTIIITTCIFLLPRTSIATVIVPVSEADLTQHATAIVIGTVKKIESYWDPQAGQISTHITIAPQDVLKGSLTPGDLILKQPGGTVGSRQMWVEGSPSLIRGEKVLLFLETNFDGSARIAQLYLGKFSLFTDNQTGKELAYRGELHLGVRILSQSSSEKRTFSAITEEFLEVAPMKERIRALVSQSGSTHAGVAGPFATPQIPARSDVEQRESFTLFSPIPARWFEPDTGDPVVMSINPENIIPNGERHVDTGMQAWSSVRGATLTFRTGSPTEAKGFRADGVSAISFSDPLGELSDPIRCTGVLAAAALTSVSSETKSLQGQTFFRITEADLVYANGWENCKVFQDLTNLDELTTHELGHVIGLGHSPNPESIMYPLAHFDGRGASLIQEDQDGVAFLYPDGTLPPCTYTLSSSGRTVSSTATTTTVTVSTSNRCGWTAFTTANWITITDGENSSGNGTVELTITANSGRKSRQATVSVAGQSFTVTQKAGGIRTPRKWVPPFAPG